MKQGIRHYIDLITVLTQKELKVRYKNSFLGYFWSIGHPLALSLVFFMAFKIFMKVRIEDYTLFLITGLFPWQCLSNSINIAPGIFLGNATIIKKVNFPRNLIPFTQVLQDMLNFVFAIPVIVLFLLIYNKTPSVTWLYGVPCLLVLQFMITYGGSLILSSANLFFRDLERLTFIFTTLLFYFTPVLYPETMVPERYRIYMELNPLAPLMISWRNLFMDGTLNPTYLAISLLYSILILGAGLLVYRSLSWRFAEVL